MAVGRVDVAVHLGALPARVELRDLLRERDNESEREGREPDQPEECLVEPDNWQSLNIFLDLDSQWNLITGLTAVFNLLLMQSNGTLVADTERTNTGREE